MGEFSHGLQALQLSQRRPYSRRSQHAHQNVVEQGFFEYLRTHFRGVIRYSPFLSLEYPEIEADWDLVNLVVGEWQEITVSDAGVHVRYQS